MCKISTLSFHAGFIGDRLLGHYILPLHLTGLFTMISYETSSQSCWKIWIWRLGFVCSYAWWCSTTFSSYMLGILAHVSGTMNGIRWTTSMACSSTCLSYLDFYLWVYLKSTVCTKEVSGDWDLQQ
jgi:hypothetical protein